MLMMSMPLIKFKTATLKLYSSLEMTVPSSFYAIMPHFCYCVVGVDFRKAKELIGRIMSKGHDMPDMQSDSHVTLEMMIPGNKAGIVIGKGGETIKLLQVLLGNSVLVRKKIFPLLQFVFPPPTPFDNIYIYGNCLEVKREYCLSCFIYCQRATSSMGTVNKNSSHSSVGPWVCLCVFRLHDLSLCSCVFCCTLVSWVISLHVLALA